MNTRVNKNNPNNFYCISEKFIPLNLFKALSVQPKHVYKLCFDILLRDPDKLLPSHIYCSSDIKQPNVKVIVSNSGFPLKLVNSKLSIRILKDCEVQTLNLKNCDRKLTIY